MIRLTWNGETLELDEDEAQGFAEGLDAEGEVYSWERIEPAAPAATAAPAEPIDWIGETRERNTYRAPTLAQEQAATRARFDAYKADLAAQAAATETPVWVIECRAQLAAARKYAKDNPYKGKVTRRLDGSWYYSDQFGASRSLPRDAGDWFADGQREP